MDLMLSKGYYKGLYGGLPAMTQCYQTLKYTLLAFEVGLYFTLFLSLWSLYSYRKQYRNKSI